MFLYFAHTNVLFEVAGIFFVVHLVIVSQVRVPWCTLVLLCSRQTHTLSFQSEEGLFLLFLSEIAFE